MNGASYLKTLINEENVSWKACDELESKIVQFSDRVTEELKKEGDSTAVWKLARDKSNRVLECDLHDDVVLGIEKGYNLIELSRNYRRRRLEKCLFK